jgi:hypothetical protein
MGDFAVSTPPAVPERLPGGSYTKNELAEMFDG